MTLGRLFELIEAQKNGKQIMAHVVNHSLTTMPTYEQEVDITRCQLMDLVREEYITNGYSENFYIKDEEDINGEKIYNKGKV